MQFSNNGYYSAMDHVNNSQFFESKEPAELDEEGNPVISDDSLNFTPGDIGISTKPGMSPLEAFKADIKQGAGRIEFTFMGAGKGSAQNPTPESVSAGERRDMRELLKINDIKTATHAGIHANSLAGFDGKSGFSNEVRSTALKEIDKAIQFAGEATRGGAVVFHMHEWQRPLSELKDKSGAKFEGHIDEGKDATFYTVDNRTGKLLFSVKKDDIIYRPVYKTAKDAGIVGQVDKSTGRVLKENDYIDEDGKYIKRNGDFSDLARRVPVLDDSGKGVFKVQPLKWEDLEREKDEYNAENGTDLNVAEYQTRIQIENSLLDIKGQQGYYISGFNAQKKQYEDLKKDYDLYKQLKNNLPEDEQWKVDAHFNKYKTRSGEDLETFFKDALESSRQDLKFREEIGTSSETKYAQAIEQLNHIEAAEKYGLKLTADTIALAGIRAMEEYHRNKDKYDLKDPIYVAPENWHQNFYGSHPDEMRQVVEKSREAMVHKLKGKYSEAEARELAKTHIKATLDIGHLNTLRYNYKGSHEDFDKWMLDEAEKLVKEGIVGHIHLSDNFGYDDEHLTPGQGNIPMKEFLRRMEARGMKDIILERGSYNENTAYFDTFAHVNAPIYGFGARQRFAQTRNAHFGQNAPGFFIAGAYAPSNDWKPWTDIPLE